MFKENAINAVFHPSYNVPNDCAESLFFWAPSENPTWEPANIHIAVSLKTTLSLNPVRLATDRPTLSFC